MHKELLRINENDFEPIKELEPNKFLMANKNSAINQLPEEVVFKRYPDAPIDIQTDEILNKIENLRKLDHKYIIKCYGVCTCKECLTLVTEYSIEPVMSNTELRHSQFPKIAKGHILNLIEAIQHSIELNYPIFNIRPSTVILNGFGGIHDLDIEYKKKPIPVGYAQAISRFHFEAEYSLHEEDVFIYTNVLTKRSVINAIGIMLYENLQGERLFGNKTDCEIYMYMKENNNILPFKPLKNKQYDQYDEQFEAIIQKATSRDQNEQYKGLSELKAALSEIIFPEVPHRKGGVYVLNSENPTIIKLKPEYPESEMKSITTNFKKALLAVKILFGFKVSAINTVAGIKENGEAREQGENKI